MPLAHETRAATPEPRPDCPICPRLVAFRATNMAAHPDWFNGAVPSFGADSARLLIVGLAPGLKGANRTGRPFLGDYAGELLYRTLLKVGLARGAHDPAKPEALTLIDCMITNAVRCVPPANKPTPSEIAHCRNFLEARIAALPGLRAILALGRIAHDSTLDALRAEAARLSLFPRRASRASDRARALRQLSLLAPEHEHREADHAHVRGGADRYRK